MSGFDGDARVVPDGVQIRGLRREHGWSRRTLVARIAEASIRATGLRETISVSQLGGIEEVNEPIPYAMLCLVAAGLDRNPVELLLE